MKMILSDIIAIQEYTKTYAHFSPFKNNFNFLYKINGF